MKSLPGTSTVALGFAAAAIVACGSETTDKSVRSPTASPQAMGDLTPIERHEVDSRVAQEEKRQMLAALRLPRQVSRTSNALAVLSVATARCDRELKCKNIGPNEKYASTDDCIDTLQKDKVPGVNAKDCPGGVSEKDLTACLQAIRDENCGKSLDSVSQHSACRASALCLQ